MTIEKAFMERLKKFAENSGDRISASQKKNKSFSINSIIQQINDMYEDVNLTYEKKPIIYNGKKYNSTMVITGIVLTPEEEVHKNGEIYQEDSMCMQQELNSGHVSPYEES